MNWGFGISFVDDFRDARYADPGFQRRVPEKI
jgi:hypothetical protein